MDEVLELALEVPGIGIYGTDSQPTCCIVLSSVSGRARSDSSGIQSQMRSAGSTTPPITPANLQRYLCQNSMTTDVQIGALLQQPLTFSMRSDLFSSRVTFGPHSKALAAVMALQLASSAFISRNASVMRLFFSVLRRSRGLFQTSTGTCSSPIPRTSSLCSPIIIKRRMLGSTKNKESVTWRPNSWRVLSHVCIFQTSCTSPRGQAADSIVCASNEPLCTLRGCESTRDTWPIMPPATPTLITRPCPLQARTSPGAIRVSSASGSEDLTMGIRSQLEACIMLGRPTTSCDGPRTGKEADVLRSTAGC
mmetsp:Transcript_17326/g.31577  ORF Transcript_17326/g.31577 Transcript_17326/m.31577 type:complete len:308 (-) Transcript_17326:347-1270(-)